ncbi:MAG TPA: DUF58 domain-containing protein [Candidatus Latescibacteria bacterium]|nr:DUF58 domain-containing protein [Candidatus Latescibacterota bacterium]
MIQKEILKKVRRIEIQTRQVVNTLLSGEYHSALKGQGMEFAEVREYQPGDDVRRIDWNVTARIRRPFVKIFDEERELTVMLMVDASSSGDFGSVEQTKNQIAVELCALLAFSATKNNDRVGLIVFTDRVEKFVPPKKGRKHVLRVIRELLAQFSRTETSEPRPFRSRPHPVMGGLASLAIVAAAASMISAIGIPETTYQWLAETVISILGAAGVGVVSWWAFRTYGADKGRGTDIAGALDFLNRVMTRRGVVFLISDFQAAGFEKALKAARRKQDVIAITLTDPREVTLKGAGLLALEDPETGESVVVDSSGKRFRDWYEQQARTRHAQRKRLFRTTGVDCVDVWTDTSYVDPLVRFFSARAKRM